MFNCKNIEDIKKFSSLKELLFLEDILSLDVFNNDYDLFYVHTQEEDALYYQLDEEESAKDISEWKEKYGDYLNVYGYTKDPIYFPHSCFSTKKDIWYGCPKNLSIWKIALNAGIYCLQEKIKEWKACPEYLEADNYFDLDLASFLVKKTGLFGPALYKDYFQEETGMVYKEYGALCINEDKDIITWKGGKNIINITCDYDSFYVRKSIK